MRYYSVRLSSLPDEVAIAAAADDDDGAVVDGGMPCNIPSRHVALRQWTNAGVVAEKK